MRLRRCHVAAHEERPAAHVERLAVVGVAAKHHAARLDQTLPLMRLQEKTAQSHPQGVGVGTRVQDLVDDRNGFAVALPDNQLVRVDETRSALFALRHQLLDFLLVGGGELGERTLECVRRLLTLSELHFELSNLHITLGMS